VTVAGEEIVRARTDSNEYRAIELPNGLQAVLVYDATTDKAAAALDVRVHGAQSLAPTRATPTRAPALDCRSAWAACWTHQHCRAWPTSLSVSVDVVQSSQGRDAGWVVHPGPPPTPPCLFRPPLQTCCSTPARSTPRRTSTRSSSATTWVPGRCAGRRTAARAPWHPAAAASLSLCTRYGLSGAPWLLRAAGRQHQRLHCSRGHQLPGRQQPGAAAAAERPQCPVRAAPAPLPPRPLRTAPLAPAPCAAGSGRPLIPLTPRGPGVQFDVNWDHLGPALDRFAQFFLCPLVSGGEGRARQAHPLRHRSAQAQLVWCHGALCTPMLCPV